MKAIITDLDDTLFMNTRLSRFFIKISQFFFNFASNFQRLNPSLKKQLDSADKVIILTSRGQWCKGSTIAELRKYGIKFDQLILPIRGDVYIKWKEEQVNGLMMILKARGYEVVWFDDEMK